MMKLIILCAIIAIAAGAPSVLVEPTSVLGRIEPQLQAPASTEHAKLIPALRYSPLLVDHSYPLLRSSYISLPYSRPYEAHSYSISY